MTKLILYVNIYNHDLYFGIGAQMTALQSDSAICFRFAVASVQCTPVCLNLTYEKNDILSYRYGQKNQSESRLEPLLGNVPSLDWNR